jgi:hypothetical protein
MAVDSHNSINCNLRSEWAPVILVVGIVGGGPSQAWLLQGIRCISSFNFCNIKFYNLHDSSCHDCCPTIDGTWIVYEFGMERKSCGNNPCRRTRVPPCMSRLGNGGPLYKFHSLLSRFHSHIYHGFRHWNKPPHNSNHQGLGDSWAQPAKSLKACDDPAKGSWWDQAVCTLPTVSKLTKCTPLIKVRNNNLVQWGHTNPGPKADFSQSFCLSTSKNLGLKGKKNYNLSGNR